MGYKKSTTYDNVQTGYSPLRGERSGQTTLTRNEVNRARDINRDLDKYKREIEDLRKLDRSSSRIDRPTLTGVGRQ